MSAGWLAAVRQYILPWHTVDIVSSDCACCPAPSSLLQVQLILPEALKLLPLYSLALHKSNMLRPDVRADDRSAWLAGVLGASPQRTMGLLHPRLYAVHNLLVRGLPGTDSSGIGNGKHAGLWRWQHYMCYMACRTCLLGS